MRDHQLVIDPDPVIEAFKRLRKMHDALRGLLALREAYSKTHP